MSIIALAEADLALTLEDLTGFGQALTVTDPAGLAKPLAGQSVDIGEVIDPDTGTAVSGRFRGVTLRLSSLAAAGLGIPVSVESGVSWIITDADGQKWAVERSAPDRTLGIVTLTLKEIKG